MDGDAQPGQFGQHAGMLGALIQQVDRQFDQIGLEAPGQQGGSVLERGAEADAAEQPARLQRLQPVPQGAALGPGQVVGAGNQQGVAARQAQPLQRPARPGLDPVDAVGDRHGADGDLEGRGEGPGLTQPPFAIAVRLGGDEGHAGVGGGLQQEAEGLLARAGRQGRIGGGVHRARGFVHDRDGQLVDRRGRAVGKHRRTVTVKV